MRINIVSRSGLLCAVTFYCMVVSGLPAAATGATNSRAVSASTNKAAKAAPKVRTFKNETEKRMAFLKAVLVIATTEMVEAMIKSFKITAKGTLAEKKAAISKYLGLLRDVKDARKAFEIVVKDVFVSPDLKKNFVVYADAGVHVRKEKDPASGLITLHGDRGNLYIKFQKQVISARLIRMDLKRKEMFGEGDAMMREGDRVITGDKFYFNSETKRGIIYNAHTYIKPYFYYGKSIKKIGDRNYVMKDGWFTTCDDKIPHYKFTVSKCWMYQDVRLLAYDVTYNVSDYPVFWFPFIFHPMEGSGIWTGLGRDTRVGWYMQLVNLGPFLGLPFNLHLDFYQRLGTAMILKPDGKHKISIKNFALDWSLGMAIDKPLEQRGTDWVNTVNGDLVSGNENGSYGDWKREFRWHIKLKPSFTLKHDPANPKSGTTSFSADFSFASDPFFISEFDTKRTKVIELEKIFRQEDVNFFTGASAQARKWSFAVSDKRGGSSLSLNGDWTYNAKDDPQKNLYANDRYAYKKSTIVLPRVSYSFSGTILSSKPLPTVVTNTNVNATNAAGVITNVSVVMSTNGKAGTKKKGPPDILDTSDDLAGSRAKQKVTYSLGYSAGINFAVTKSYSDVDESLLQKVYNRGLSLSVPASFSIGSAFSSKLNLSLNDAEQWGETTTTNQIQANDKATKTTFNESASISLAHTFNKGLLSEIGGSLSISHSLSARLSDEPESGDLYDTISSHRMGVSASLNFFKTKISASTGFDMAVLKDETRNWGRDRFDNLSLSFTSSPFSFLTISDSFSYIIKTGQATANSMSVSLKAPAFRLPIISKVSTLSAGFSWYHSYTDHRANKLTFTLSMSIEINKLWSLSLSMSTLNKELYLYSSDYAAEYGKESRSFFKDLGYSLMFWDTDKLQETRFNLQSFNLNLSHDLHEWLLKLSVSMNPGKRTMEGSSRQFTYLDFNIVLSISMKNNIGINFPDHRYRYTADGSGNYYGKYN